MRSVTKATGPYLAFAYGASGQRTQKQVGDPVTDPNAYREHYIRDAQGNIMATYRYTNNTGASLKLNERPLYGSSRLGSMRKEVELHTLAAFDPASANPVQMVDLNYELTDHLGNVCAVVTGRLLDGNGGGTAKQAELVSAQGYEPFGALLSGRNYSSDSYRFGFNGAEKDDEIHGSTGTSYDFGARMFDPRVSRWLSLDPLGAKYPAISPYAFALNSPLLFMDPNGKEGVVTIQRNPNGGGTITISTIVYVTGAGASQAKVDEFNSGYKNFVQAGTYTDASGQKFDVNINITFKYAPDRSAITLQRGENILELTDENIRSHAKGESSTVRSLDPKTGEWTLSFSAALGQLAKLGKNDHDAETATHEVLHLLGLSDRYKDIPLFGRNAQNELVQTRTVSQGDPGFEHDIMGTGIGFSPVHTENFGNYILGQESSKGSKFILDRFVDLDESGNLIGGEPIKKP